ncbi:glycine cleavage system protein GcvH [Candidatus Protochlamydia phocaeensis]|uniref:glycine cleavage system protein GcvH n=1 Tax=Candidatus Protochlamydia phocaeensis TaxID=1414722 RepID=UPI0009AF12FA|nr:glycine cleavage system protein GcvH [Candidatus Protochlamydia phocaeensis]
MKFTDSHEWIEMETTDVARVGVSQYAQKELGDIVYIELPTAGRPLNAGQEAAVLESTKAAADVYSPASGTIIEVNERLANAPELVNQSPEKEGWLFKIRLSNPSELDLLMEQKDYQAMLNGA